jgi:hypothetical protein
MTFERFSTALRVVSLYFASGTVRPVKIVLPGSLASSGDKFAGSEAKIPFLNKPACISRRVIDLLNVPNLFILST